MADSPKFALYVSSVEGRLVSRPGSPHSYIGASVRSPEEIKAGQTEPSWTPDVIVPVLETEYLRFVREWDALVRDGDLVARKAEEFASYQQAQAKAEKARDAELAKPPKPEKKPADEAVAQGGA